MKSAVLIGDDKLGRRLIQRLESIDDTMIVIDRSQSLSRVYRLLQRRSLTLRSLQQMGWADLCRQDTQVSGSYPSISSNQELLEFLESRQISRLFLFRAGLIIGRKLLDADVVLINVHCARLPDYGGIGVISRALKDRAFDQEATAHIVTEDIDRGEIVATRPYQLARDQSYRENEDRAYLAGIELLTSLVAQTDAEAA
jgi:methionyl-tRNA formyltransferase